MSWVLEMKGVTNPSLFRRFLTMGPPASTTCEENLNVIKDVCIHLGIPLAMEKLEGPTTSLTFLGIVLDTERMEI